MRSRVTDAGCASNATRLPRKPFAQRARSEQAIQTELHRALPSSEHGESRGVVKVGLVARVPQREIARRARAILDDGRQAHAPRPWCVGERARFPCWPSHAARSASRATAIDGGACKRERPHALPIAVELVRGPLRRRREIELAVASTGAGGDERLEARVLPEPLGALRRRAARNRELRQARRSTGTRSAASAGASSTLRSDGEPGDAACTAPMRRERVGRHSILPGFMMPCGSSACLSVRISASAVGDL